MSITYKLNEEQIRDMFHLDAILAYSGMSILTSQIDDGDVCFWIGDVGDMSVGIPSFEFSPYLPTVEALNDWCMHYQSAINAELERSMDDGDTASLAHLELPKNSISQGGGPTA